MIIHDNCREWLAAGGLDGVDAVLTDPPYGIVLANHGRRGGRRNAPYRIVNDSPSDSVVVVDFLKEAKRRAVPTIVFASPWRPWPGRWRNLIVWDKGEGVGGGGDVRTCLKRTWELIQVRGNGPMRGPRVGSVWRFPVAPQDSAEHVAAKPLPLLIRLLDRFTNPGDLVADPFAGSGSTGVACAMTGRRFVGVEIDESLAALARRRIQKTIQESKSYLPFQED